MADGGGGRNDSSDKARDEFFSEAQELIDALGRDLLALDDVLRSGRADVELVNDVFRGVHTLKGLSALFGVTRMAGLSHELEDVLDDLRLGRLELNAALLDLLFRAVTLFGKVLSAEKGEIPEPVAEVEQLLVALGQTSQQSAGEGTGVVAQYDLDPGLFGVLTEYEEHRLRSNIQQGLSLYRIRVRFSLSTIDSALDELKASARPHGEIITYLPTGAGADVDTIELEILMAGRSPLDELRQALAGPNVVIEEVRRRGGGSGPRPAGASGPDRGRSSATRPAPSPGPRSTWLVRRSSDVPRPDGDPVEALDRAASGRGTSVSRRAAAAEMSLRSVSQTVRVDIRKLDRLMTIVGELAIVKTAITRLSDQARTKAADPRELAMELQRLNRTFDRHLAQMQGGILEVRMVPLGQVFDKLARVVRQISREVGKEVNLVVTGAETEIDKLIVEELSDPLMHMIRNAIDHAIEVRSDRLRVGEAARGDHRAQRVPEGQPRRHRGRGRRSRNEPRGHPRGGRPPRSRQPGRLRAALAARGALARLHAGLHDAQRDRHGPERPGRGPRRREDEHLEARRRRRRHERSREIGARSSPSTLPITARDHQRPPPSRSRAGSSPCRWRTSRRRSSSTLTQLRNIDSGARWSRCEARRCPSAAWRISSPCRTSGGGASSWSWPRSPSRRHRASWSTSSSASATS